MSNETIERTQQKRQDCWNHALHSFGFGYLYSLKAAKLRKVLKFNSFLGIIIPVLIGGVVTTYGLQSHFLDTLLFIIAPVSIIQLVVSTWIVSHNLEDKYSHYLESSHDNYLIASNFENIGKYPPKNLKDLDYEIEKCLIQRKNRDSLDIKYYISEKEKRRAMRYSLRKYKRSCAGCNNIPVDMKATACGVCGNF